MKFHCIAVPVLHPEAQLEALDRFLAQHPILSVDKVFSQQGDQGNRAQLDAGWHFLTQRKACPPVLRICRQMFHLCRYVSSLVDACAKACRHFPMTHRLESGLIVGAGE